MRLIFLLLALTIHACGTDQTETTTTPTVEPEKPAPTASERLTAFKDTNLAPLQSGAKWKDSWSTEGLTVSEVPSEDRLVLGANGVTWDIAVKFCPSTRVIASYDTTEVTLCDDLVLLEIDRLKLGETITVLSTDALAYARRKTERVSDPTLGFVVLLTARRLVSPKLSLTASICDLSGRIYSLVINRDGVISSTSDESICSASL